MVEKPLNPIEALCLAGLLRLSLVWQRWTTPREKDSRWICHYVAGSKPETPPKKMVSDLIIVCVIAAGFLMAFTLQSLGCYRGGSCTLASSWWGELAAGFFNL